MEKLPFPLDVGFNGFPNLKAPQMLLAHGADDAADMKPHPIQKFDVIRIFPAVDVVDRIAVLVFIQPAGVFKELEAHADLFRHLAQALCPADVELDHSPGVPFLRQVQAHQVYIPFGPGGAGFADALDGDLFHQPLIVGLHGVQPVDHVINAVRPVGGGIAQGQHGVELFDIFLCLLSFHGLRLVNDQDGVGFGDDVDGAAGAEFVQLHGDPPGVFAFGVKGLGVDDHDVDGAVGSKAVDFRQLGGIVDEVADLLAVFFGEMFLRHLEGFVYALPDGDAGDHDDELRPAVVLVQLIHGLDVGISLAHAGFHFDGEVIPALQPFRRLDLVCPLDLADMLQHHVVAELRDQPLVPPAGEIVRKTLHAVLVLLVPPVDHIGRRKIRLPGEDVYHSLRRVRLEFLVLELELHLSLTPYLTISNHARSFATQCEVV